MTSSKRGVSDSRFVTKQVHLIRKRGMVTKTLPIAEEIVAFDDYLRFGTDDEAPKGDTSRRAYLWTAEMFTRFLDGRELSPQLAREFIKELEEIGPPVSTATSGH